MADQLTPRGSALLSGTRRRLVKAGAAVAWTVPVMHTLTAQQAFAVTPCVTVTPTLRKTNLGPCDERDLQPKICCNTGEAYFIRFRVCATTTCTSLSLTATLPALLVFQDGCAKVCVDSTDVTGSSSITCAGHGQSGAVTVTLPGSLAAGQCANIDIFVKRGSECPPSSGSVNVTYSVTCGGTSGCSLTNQVLSLPFGSC